MIAFFVGIGATLYCVGWEGDRLTGTLFFLLALIARDLYQTQVVLLALTDMEIKKGDFLFRAFGVERTPRDGA